MSEHFLRVAGDLLELALPIMVIALGSSWIVLRIGSIKLAKSARMFPAAFAILGGICGVIVGSSFESIIGGLITGVLGIVSGILSYAFAKESDADFKAAIPAMIMLLMINVLVGLSVGQSWKRKWEQYAAEVVEYRARLDQIWVPVNREYQTQILRRCLIQNPRYADAVKMCKYETLFPD
ncbi:MAG TPA: hypothetical protein VE053_02030 [Allosphingosinicella sp.]|nr:hypothetical protein [Allosphingosinicella sp.]